MSAHLEEPVRAGHFDRLSVPAGGGTPASPVAGAAGAPDLRLLELADQCVLCGLCLPHCPTYRLDRLESESPRGRIALAKALTTGRIEPTPAALAHLDHCLACLSCQKVCPSEVRYDEIITRSRAGLRALRPRPGFLQRLFRDSGRLVVLARIGATLRAQRWLPPLLRRLPVNWRWRALADEMPDVPAIAAKHPPRRPGEPTRGRVVLFRGCVASVYDRDTHAAAKILLDALGYEVVIPPGTPCCGALARHAGETETADHQVITTREALRADSGDAVLVSASGCFGDLRDHVLDGTASTARDIHAFLARDERFASLCFRPLAIRAALHVPCTQANVVGDVASIRALLARIPGLTLLSLPEQPRCCGAAGSYFIEQPDRANRLRAERLDQVQTQEPDLLLTTNIGCRIHLGNGLRQRAAAIPVLHPLALLAQQLDNTSP